VLLNILLLQVTSPASSNPILGFLPILLIFGIFYFLLFLPMQRQKKQQQKMLKELEAGLTVLTSGGVIGTIQKLDDDRLVLRVRPDGIKLEVARSAVTSVLTGESAKS
jgi:preprotein translocase subunit YajC